MLHPKCIYRKSVFAKCTRLACLLRFASLFYNNKLTKLSGIIVINVNNTSRKYLSVAKEFPIRKEVTTRKMIEKWKTGDWPAREMKRRVLTATKLELAYGGYSRKRQSLHIRIFCHFSGRGHLMLEITRALLCCLCNCFKLKIHWIKFNWQGWLW